MYEKQSCGESRNLLAKCNVCTVASVSEKGYPNYCIIHFIANEATVYIDGKFETLEI